MNNEDLLISMLIEETCNEPVEASQQEAPLDLRGYFEKRLNEIEFNSISDYLIKNNLKNYLLRLDLDSQCYRLSMNQKILDFPSNWSIFNEITNSQIVYLDRSRNNDFLLDIFEEICGTFQNIALVKDNNEIQFVFLPEEFSRGHLSWMHNYYDKKNAA